MSEVNVNLDEVEELLNSREVSQEVYRQGVQLRLEAVPLAPRRTGLLISKILVKKSGIGEIRVSTEAARKLFNYGMFQELKKKYLRTALRRRQLS